MWANAVSVAGFGVTPYRRSLHKSPRWRLALADRLTTFAMNSVAVLRPSLIGDKVDATCARLKRLLAETSD